MAFSFTLPELQAELRALGHDGLPDHVILNFLAQLNLPRPCPYAPSNSSSTSLDSSGYDTDASFCSTHSLSCGCDSPKEPITCAGDADIPSSVEESASFSKSKTKFRLVELSDGVSADNDPWRGNACPLTEALCCNGNGLQTVRHCQKGNSSESARTERGQTSSQYAENLKPGAGCEVRGTPHSQVTQETGKQASPDKLMEHYWISVGEEHMRAMHSRSPSKQQIRGLPAMESKHATLATGAREGKIGYGSLIEKVEQCEGELQRLTLRLQAQQCKRPWFLVAARKPRALQTEKQGVEYPIQESHLVSSSEPETMQIEQCSDGSQLSVIAVPNTQTPTDIPGKKYKSSSLIVQEFEEAPGENYQAVSKGVSKELVDKEIKQTYALETKSANTFSASEHYQPEESSQHQYQKVVAIMELGLDKRDGPDPSVCSKSSSASYQHSRSSGDSRSNVSQQASVHVSSRRQPCSTLQQPRRRGGKIDRVARYAEMQRVWKKDAFLAANEPGGKRKRIQGFHHHISNLHSTS